MTFREYMLHQLREMRRELLTATEGLSGDDLTSFEPVGHWPVAWISEHCAEVADRFLYKSVHEGYLLSYAPHVENWQQQEPKPGDPYPSAEEMRTRWQQVCDAIIEYVERAPEETLQGTYGIEPYVQSILRVINHTNSHLRSLWCILGERRVDDKFAEQQSFLA